MARMHDIGPRPNQSPERGGQKRGLTLHDRDTPSTTTNGDGEFTITRTFTLTFVATFVTTVPTTTTTSCTLDPVIPTSAVIPTESSALPSSSSSSSSMNRPFPVDMMTTSVPSSTLATSAEAATSGATGTPRSSAIIVVIVVVFVLIFMIAFFLAWKRRKRTRTQWTTDLEDSSQVGKTSGSSTTEKGSRLRPHYSRAGSIRPSRLPKFPFGEGYGRNLPTSNASAERPRLNTLTTSYQTNDPNGSRSPKLILYSPQSGISPSSKAIVLNTFVTDLPDELPVAFGQRLDVLEEYDDGWTLCANEKGEQGMVPIECLAVVYTGKEVYSRQI